MKITWEKDDIKPGLRVGKPERAEQWMVGYHQPPSSPVEYCLISLTDGLISVRGTQNGIAAHLNETGDIPVALFQ